MKIVSIGEILWDVFPDGERLGGAPFNFAVAMHRLGHEVRFVSAVGDDRRGLLALERMAELGLSTEFVRVVHDAPTGYVTVSLNGSEPDYVIHRPAAYDFLEIPKIEADWWCYGTLAWRSPARQRELASRKFYDLNLRKDSFSRELIEELLDAADVVKLNEAELKYLSLSLEGLRDRYDLQACCVTRGERGCSVLIGDDRADVPAAPAQVSDAVGAGDAFSAGFLHALDQGWPAATVGEFANATALAALTSASTRRQ